MNRIEQLLEDIADEMYAITSDMELVSAVEVGLDMRCGKLYVGKEGIVVRKDKRQRLDYYGGFEYIKEHAYELADYVYYSREDIRVEECIQYYMNKGEEQEEEIEEEE